MLSADEIALQSLDLQADESVPALAAKWDSHVFLESPLESDLELRRARQYKVQYIAQFSTMVICQKLDTSEGTCLQNPAPQHRHHHRLESIHNLGAQAVSYR